ncbi:MAG: arsenosugar biosynthesis radical SAM (seleno)protein ArsS [Thermodesulfobacteriota bacterium]
MSLQSAAQEEGAPERASWLPFARRLEGQGLELRRTGITTLQINVGRLCNQTCRHCHLEAGPDRPEIMDGETMAAVMAYAATARVDVCDITGGAPELVPGIEELVAGLVQPGRQLLFRTNLTLITEPGGRPLLDLLRRLQVALVASFPSTDPGQTASLRGRGVWERSLAALAALNRLGYGQEDTGLTLNLVVNPAGAFLPPGQEQAQRQFRRVLASRWGIRFNRLFTFANAPLGRFRSWLKSSGNLERYQGRLAACFNPCTLDGLMCRTLVSVGWHGQLADCDFNLAAGLTWEAGRLRVQDLATLPLAGRPIAVGDHCYACTAGAGFT